MIVWSVFAVGAVYVWAAAPLMAGAALLAALAPSTPGASRETRTLDALLVASVVAAAAQLVPLPPAIRAAVSPRAKTVVSAASLLDGDEWQPLSVSPASTAYSIGLVLTALVVFWTARSCCARGLTLRLVRHVAFAGLLVALSAIACHAVGDRSLIYGRLRPLDAGAHPFGPFVNRNHFATWVVMACPLAAGYVAAALRREPSPPGAAARLLAAFEWLGTTAAWVGVSGIVMLLGLVASTSRSGLIALAASLVCGAWLSRGRLTPRRGLFGLLAALVLVALVSTLVNVLPLLARVEETLRVGLGGRPRIWHETLRIIRDFPLTGTGLGGYQTAMFVYQENRRALFINQAHSQYLHLFAEGGLLLSIPVTLAVVAFVRLIRERLAHDTPSDACLRIGAASAIVAVAVQGFWETGLRIPANGLLLAATAAVAVHRPSCASRASSST